MPAIQLMTVSNTETSPAVETSGVKSQKLQGLHGTFSNYLQQNSSNTAQAAKQQNVMTQDHTKTTGNDSSIQQQYEQYQNQSAAQAEKISESTDTGSADADAVTQAVEDAVENVKEILKENLGVDEEQLEAAMELLGLVQTDLLDPKQLILLTVELTGSENAGMMLFDENFQTVMQEVTVVTEDLLKDLGMTMDELMEQVNAVPAETVQPKKAVPAAEAPAAEVPAELETAETSEVPTDQELPKEEAPETAVEITREAKPVEKAEQPKQQTAQVQEEVQPQETKPLQDTQPKQQQMQSGQQENAQENLPETFTRDTETQEHPRFEFHTNVSHQEQTFAASTPQNVTVHQAPLPQVNMQEVIQQIVEYTKVHLSEDVKSIEMQLNPENLGKVYLHVSEKQGTVTAQLTAQNENMKEALVQQAAVLKESLNQQGIKVDAVEVSAGTHEFESSLERDARGQEEQARQQEEQNSRRSRRNINLNDINSLDGLSGLMSEEEVLAAQIMRDNGNNVDYKA